MFLNIRHKQKHVVGNIISRFDIYAAINLLMSKLQVILEMDDNPKLNEPFNRTHFNLIGKRE